ncbi:MAG: molybdenum ABC transporter ATP-binding protein [Gammaproteobacteria bacterium]|jgi:molybdate transport system ATP-binding protein
MSRLELDIALERKEFRLAVSESLDLTGITAVFGANGSGKTSLLRVIAGLERSAQGSVMFRDLEWQGPTGFRKPEQRATGFVFQDGRLFSHLDVEGNLRFPRRSGGRKGEIGFEPTVEAFGLAKLLNRHTGSLSGGERQRVAIARALLANPDLLLMDEPLSSLDQPRKAGLLRLIRELPTRYGIPVILVTHDVDELVYLADEVVLLADGKNVASGSAREILERSDFEQLTHLGEPGAVLEAEVSAQTDGLTTVSMSGGELRIPHFACSVGDKIRLRIHPRDVILAIERPTGISIRNSLATTVRALEAAGDEQVMVTLAAGDQQLKARITRDAANDLALEPGQPIHALIKTVALDAFG